MLSQMIKHNLLNTGSLVLTSEAHIDLENFIQMWDNFGMAGTKL